MDPTIEIGLHRKILRMLLDRQIEFSIDYAAQRIEWRVYTSKGWTDRYGSLEDALRIAGLGKEADVVARSRSTFDPDKL